ncbi:sulfite exporter TauE/SafE family protein [Hoeflea sp. YIM 152468]|uniref:sulfite exporter TauE/SafE family protein n=1 Tax=Hoeflea sp. YIM 152468 TaxID=3031759 RepID=UPI0023DB95DE|nr:sulfite exporter TauE/SafE family protein [Hoeflea sp. YIM 152468]MDF1607545.1 sulfite exporter TauE/SafE family protein [Hoeflea sp. YIM 152468]
MSIFDVLLLFFAGFLSSVVNAIAGGGTFLTFGAMTLTGVPPIMANATSSVTQLPGYITSALAYRTEIREAGREVWLLAGLSLVGSLLGALILVSLSNPSFRSLVPWLLLAATLIFAAGPYLRPKTLHPEKPVSRLGLVFQFITSIYGGFFGAGMGIMMLAVLGLTKGGDYHKLNALKNVIAVVIAFVAIVVFSSGGVVAWLPAVIMIPAGALGGYAGVWAARRVPQSVIRAAVVAVGLGLTWYYFAT